MRHRGFTLVEVLAVLAVLGVLAALGFSSLNTYIQSSRLREATLTLAQTIRSVGGAALTNSQPYNAQLTLNSGSITWQSDDTAYAQAVSVTLPYGATVSSCSCSAKAYRLSFTGRGLPLAGYDLQVSLYGKARTVTVLPTGKVVLP